MPSLCTVCGRIFCDHTSSERGQSHDEMMRDLTDEEAEAWQRGPTGSRALIELAKRNAHLPTGK